MFAEGSFDAVVAFMSLMDGPRFDLAMREAFRRELLDPAGWVERWRFTDAPRDVPEFATPRFDRTLSEYVNTLIAASFVLERIEEPRPSEEYCLAHPSQLGWRDHAAVFLYFRATKPPAARA